MTALLRYRTALLLRSYRWLPPLLLYAAFLAIGLTAGPQPLLDSLGWNAAALLPASAWLVRVCVTGEPPPPARAWRRPRDRCGRTWRGCWPRWCARRRMGVAGTCVVLWVADPHTTDHLKAVPVGLTEVSGVLAVLVSALLGTAVGALTNPPVLLRPGWAVPVTTGAAVAVLVAAWFARERRGPRSGRGLAHRPRSLPCAVTPGRRGPRRRCCGDRGSPERPPRMTVRQHLSSPGPCARPAPPARRRGGMRAAWRTAARLNTDLSRSTSRTYAP